MWKTETLYSLNNKSSFSPHLSSWHPLCYILSVRTWLHYIFHKSKIVWYFAFCDWLFSLNTISSRFIHVAPHVRIPLFFKTEKYSLEKNQLIGKYPDAGKDWGQEEKQVTEVEIIGCHHWLSGHEVKQTLGDSEGQGSLVCCSPWGHKELDRVSDWTTTVFHCLDMPLLFIHSSITETWIASAFWLLWIVLLWTWVDKYLHESFQLSCICNTSGIAIRSDQIRSVAQSCPTLCDPMNHNII